MKLQGLTPERPLTHDLFATTLEELGARIDRVVISELADETFHARIMLERDGRTVEVDARPSDALALAVRSEVPHLRRRGGPRPGGARRRRRHRRRARARRARRSRRPASRWSIRASTSSATSSTRSTSTPRARAARARASRATRRALEADHPGQRPGVATVDVLEVVALGQQPDLARVEPDDVDRALPEVGVDGVGQRCRGSRRGGSGRR